MQNKNQDLSDEQVAKKVQKGDEESFGILMERYEKRLIRYAHKFLFSRTDADDLVQEVFIKAYRNIQGFDTERKFSSWIYRIAHNEFINEIKKNKKAPLLFFEFDIIMPQIKNKIEKTQNEFDKKELKNILDECLEKINIKYREPLILHYFEELSYQEISDIMHIPVSTVGVRLNRARKIIKGICKKLDI